jgi:hypothetical protein
MKLEEALEFWRGSGYKKINAVLIQDKTEKLPSHYANTTRNSTPESRAHLRTIIRTLKAAMKPLDTDETYYRADGAYKMKNCHIETFTSITVNKEDAEAFLDENSVLYRVIVKKGVKGIKTGVEGEILVEDDCFWEYKKKGETNQVTIYPPSDELEFPYCSLRVTKGGRRRTRRSRRRPL